MRSCTFSRRGLYTRWRRCSGRLRFTSTHSSKCNAQPLVQAHYNPAMQNVPWGGVQVQISLTPTHSFILQIYSHDDSLVLSHSHSYYHTLTHTPQHFVLVVVMKSKQLKIKISHALILTHTFISTVHYTPHHHWRSHTHSTR